jgi:hypothetical protein
LDRSTQTGPGWKTYLDWNALAPQIAAGGQADLKTLRAGLVKLAADVEGLELPEFAQLRTALRSHVDLLEALAVADLNARYEAEIEALAAAVEQYHQQPSEEHAAQVGGRLGWLERHRQGRLAARLVRRRSEQPNLLVDASRDMVAVGIERPVDDVSPVTDLILGTSIYGTGRTVGQVRLELVPNPHRASFDTLLSGTTYTRTVGYNGPAIIYATGATGISARKRLEMDLHGPEGRPSTTAARTSTTITGVSSSRDGCMGKIVERVASKRAASSKSQAEWIGARHAEQRLARRVDDEAQGLLTKARQNYLQKFRNPLLRRGEFPQRFEMSTTADSVSLVSLAANAAQLGAPTPPPPLADRHALAVRLHESLVNNLAAALLAGQTLREEELQAQIIEWRGSLPDKLKTDEERGPWSITFARARPISLSIHEGGFRITIRGQKYTSGEEEFRAMNVTATYKVQLEGQGTRLVRQGELEVFPPNFVAGQSRLSPGDIALKRLLEKKFSKLFEPEIKSDGLALSGKWEKVGKLPLKQLHADGGWLVLGWALPSTLPAPAVAVSAR